MSDEDALRLLAAAGLGDHTGTTIMITGRIQHVMNIMSTRPIDPHVRALALGELASMLTAAATGWRSYLLSQHRLDLDDEHA